MRVYTEARIKIAVQKSGRLRTTPSSCSCAAGSSYSRGKDQLICYGENMPVDVLLVRDDDIPRLVQEDICDLGIVGLNIIEERSSRWSSKATRSCSRRSAASISASAGYRSACPTGASPARSRSTASGSRRRIHGYSRPISHDHGVTAQIISFSGAVEIAPSLGKADLICDFVSSGSTLRAHQLYEAETILESRASLIQTPAAIRDDKAQWLQRLLQRIQGVLQVKESKYIMLHAPRSALKEIRALLPGSESPTIIPLEGRDDKVAVHAVCRENVFWETLEQLKEAGASSMLVLPVEKMLA